MTHVTCALALVGKALGPWQDMGDLRFRDLKWKESRLTFREWIGFRRNLDYAKAPWLGCIVGVATCVIAFVVVVGSIATLFRFLVEVFRVDANHEAIRNIGLIVVAVLGAPFVVWRAMVAQKQADTAEQSHITDQINKAVAGLGVEKTVNKIGRPIKILMGKSQEVTHFVENPDNFALKPRSLEIRRYYDTSTSCSGDEIFSGTHIDVRTWEKERTEVEWQSSPLAIADGEAISGVGDWSVFSETQPNLEVRVGAIYALERIAQDSLRDHIQIMEILTAYIRENAPVGSLEPTEEPFSPARPRADVQATLDVIGRRAPDSVVLEHSKKYRLDLREVDLSGANLSRGNFEGALLYGSRLEATNFRSANLRAARLQGCLLNFADFFKADLCGAIIDHARISSVDAWNASITLAENMRGLSMAGSDLSAIRFLPPKETHSPTFATKDTRFHADIMHKRERLAEDIEQFMFLANGNDIDDEIGVRERLTQAGFLYWSPFDASDGATNSLRAKLWDDIGLEGFPYRDPQV